MKNVGFIGCGNMGSAILEGIVNGGVCPGGNVIVYDLDIARTNSLVDKYGVKSMSVKGLVGHCDYIFIAVKPQNSAGVFDSIKDALDNTKTIVSIMAGVKIDAMQSAIGKEMAIVRAMPNLAAFVGESMTSYACNSLVEDKEFVDRLFSATGEAALVEEEMLDAVTALSGSGPAYLFFLADALIAAGVESGLNEETARKLAIKTVTGSASYLASSGKEPADLIKSVASKGGTTEAALNSFAENDLKNKIIEAVLKAKKRSVELSK